MTSLGVIVPVALGLVVGLAKISVLLLNYRKLRQRKRLVEAPQAVPVLEIGSEASLPDPSLERVLHALDSLGRSDRVAFIVLARSTDRYVQVDLAGTDRFHVQARMDDNRPARQFAACDKSIGGGATAGLALGDVKSIFSRFLADGTLDPAYRWRDITNTF